ncbi:MAG: hypothetical protein F6K41_25670 [Symploca sp. SIO3E6]|nr:hypothetical protein [Caldora sp. SIO3E6]
MNQPHFLKKLPVPVRMLFRPMLLISLGLHAVVLMSPTLPNWRKVEPLKKEEAIKVTKLPPAVEPSPEASPQLSPQPTTQSSSQRSQPTSERSQPTSPRTTTNIPQSTSPQATTNIPQPTVPRTYPKPIYQQPIYQQPTYQTPTYQTPTYQQQPYSPEPKKVVKEVNQPEQNSNQQEPQVPENQTPENQTPENQSPENQSPENQTPSPTTNNQTQNPPADPSIEFFEKFPRYPDAAQGSGGVLRPGFEEAAYLFNTEDDWQAVAAKFEKELLPNDDFASPQEVTDTDDFKVYKVSTATGDETKYLHLIANDGKVAIYLESDKYSLNQLMELKIEDNPEYLLFTLYVSSAISKTKDKDELLEDFDKDLDLLNDKEIFTQGSFDLDNARKTKSSSVKPRDIVESLNKNLQVVNSKSKLEEDQQIEELSEVGKYGNDNLLYLVKNSKFSSYVTLAPAKNHQGEPITVMILSDQDPRRIN